MNYGGHNNDIEHLTLLRRNPGSGSPCGACKFLRRKCAKGCVFAPYFSHEQGSSHFSAIHKVFGASNVSKLLAHLPISDRCEAAVTIAYEAQARVQDPIYGCVSHIFALQQQVVYLQAQVVSLREQAAQTTINTSNFTNPNYDPKLNPTSSFFLHDFQTWLQNQNNNVENFPYFAPGPMALNPNHARPESSGFQEEDEEKKKKKKKNSFESIMHSLDLQSSSNEPWVFQVDADDLQSVAFRYIKH